VRRLLFRLAEDVFCHAEEHELTVFAPTRNESLIHSVRLSTKYSRQKPAEQPGFYLLSVEHGEVEAECIRMARPFVLNETDLELHYGYDAVEFEQKLVSLLQEQTGGTTVFRDEPGTGKTLLSNI
jgi:hypothetical protein